MNTLIHINFTFKAETDRQQKQRDALIAAFLLKPVTNDNILEAASERGFDFQYYMDNNTPEKVPHAIQRLFMAMKTLHVLGFTPNMNLTYAPTELPKWGRTSHITTVDPQTGSQTISVQFMEKNETTANRIIPSVVETIKTMIPSAHVSVAIMNASTVTH